MRIAWPPPMERPARARCSRSGIVRKCESMNGTKSLEMTLSNNVYRSSLIEFIDRGDGGFGVDPGHPILVNYDHRLGFVSSDQIIQNEVLTSLMAPGGFVFTPPMLKV